MTDITDQQRREVAERLRDREMTEGMDRTDWGSEHDYTVWLEAQLFWLRTCLLPAADRTETWTFEQLLDVLSDLIDRPTCQNVSVTGNFVCSECGADYYMGIDVWRYCPECGAEVAR